MTVIIERDPSLVELYQSALGSTGAVVDSVDGLSAYLTSQADEYAVVLGPTVAARDAVEVAERLRINRPSLSVILVRARIDSAVLAEALRAGIREVVESRDLNALALAVRRAYNLWEAMTGENSEEQEGSATGVLVTSFSTKGGVGKSTVAINAAAALAAAGQRVCLVDLDLQDGDVAIMLQLLPKRTLAELSDMAGVIDRTGVESLLLNYSENLSVLAAPPRMDAVDRLSPESVGRVLELLKRMFDYVVVDTSGAFDDYALHALDHSDIVMLVGTLDIPALKSLKVATETLELLSIPKNKWRLVLNRADARVGLSEGDFQQTLGFEISVSMPSSREVLAAVNAGQVMVVQHPRHPVSQAVKELTRGFGAPESTTGNARAQHIDESQPRGILRRKVRRA